MDRPRRDVGPPAVALRIIDGEAVAYDDDGVTSFNRVRYRHHDESVFLYAFDPTELNGDDLRRDSLESRRATLEMILAKAGAGIQFNELRSGDRKRPLALAPFNPASR